MLSRIVISELAKASLGQCGRESSMVSSRHYYFMDWATDDPVAPDVLTMLFGRNGWDYSYFLISGRCRLRDGRTFRRGYVCFKLSKRYIDVRLRYSHGEMNIWVMKPDSHSIDYNYIRNCMFGDYLEKAGLSIPSHFILKMNCFTDRSILYGRLCGLDSLVDNERDYMLSKRGLFDIYLKRRFNK